MFAKVFVFCFCLLSLRRSESPHFTKRGKLVEVDEILHGKCQNVTVELCKDVGYLQTIVPNSLGNRNQIEAEKDLQQYSMLISSKCSPYIKLFLCTAYVPVCTSLDHPLPPCKSLCLLAKNGCEQVLIGFSLTWPEAFKCERYNNTQPCIEKNQDNSEHKSTPKDTIVLDPPHMFETPKELKYKVILGPKMVVENCGIPCNDTYMFLGTAQSAVRFALGFFSIFCLVSSLVTVATFLVDLRRFVYPQRPFAYIAACHVFVCLIFVVGFATQGNVACTEVSPKGFPLMKSYIAVQGSHEGLCTTSFAVGYYFQMTGHLWWVGLNLTLLMSACLKWSQEAITKNAKYLHIVTWSVPGLQTVLVLFLSRLDGDPIAGTCSLVEPDQVKLFVFVPLVFFTVLGVFCWSASLVSLNKVRNAVQSEGVSPNKLNKFMLRVGAFGLLYLSATILYLSCVFYDQASRQDWLVQWFFRSCPWCQDHYPKWQQEGTMHYVSPPSPYFHLLKNFSLLSVGLSSGFWVWNRKLCSSWGNLFGASKR